MKTLLKPRRLFLLLFSILFMLTVFLFKTKRIYHLIYTEDAHYVGSDNCIKCHEQTYQYWKTTLHAKMFRKADSAQNVLANFDSPDAPTDFSVSDIDWVLGSKWEQFYVKRVDNDTYVLPSRWIVGKKKWEPYHPKDWSERPMSKLCNGCHTTGYIKDSGEYVEDSIGCEACHGPGSKHLYSEKKEDIYSDVGPEVCGRCHSRGKDLSGEYNFPVGYEAGESLNDNFKQISFTEGKNTKWWYGNGMEKKRHQEYPAWLNSKHAKSLERLKEKKDRGRGEIKGYCLKCHSTDYIFSQGQNKVTVEKAKYGVTCVVCHDPHPPFREQMSLLERDRERGNMCGICHVDSQMKKYVNSRSHTPCPKGAVTCIDCHMPKVGKSAKAYNMRSHLFKVVTPEDSEKYEIPSPCLQGNCHKTETFNWVKENYYKWYPKTEKDTGMKLS